MYFVIIKRNGEYELATGMMVSKQIAKDEMLFSKNNISEKVFLVKVIDHT